MRIQHSATHALAPPVRAAACLPTHSRRSSQTMPPRSSRCAAAGRQARAHRARRVHRAHQLPGGAASPRPSLHRQLHHITTAAGGRRWSGGKKEGKEKEKEASAATEEVDVVVETPQPAARQESAEENPFKKKPAAAGDERSSQVGAAVHRPAARTPSPQTGSQFAAHACWAPFGAGRQRGEHARLGAGHDGSLPRARGRREPLPQAAPRGSLIPARRTRTPHGHELARPRQTSGTKVACVGGLSRVLAAPLSKAAVGSHGSVVCLCVASWNISLATRNKTLSEHPKREASPRSRLSATASAAVRCSRSRSSGVTPRVTGVSSRGRGRGLFPRTGAGLGARPKPVPQVREQVAA